MAGYFSKFLSDRQNKIVEHIARSMGFDFDKIEYYKTKEYLFELGAVDIAVFYPTRDFNYFLVSTVGLSAYKLDPRLARAELFMLLPPVWEMDMEKSEYNWPVELLKDVALNIIENKMGVFANQVYEMENNPYLPGTDTQGGVVVFPEMMPLEIFEVKIDGNYTRLFQLVPLSKSQLLKINDVGVDAFIEFDLHDASGVTNVVAKEPIIKKGSNIDSIIKRNTRSLKE